MSIRAKAIQTLFRTKRVTIDGVRQAVADGIITAAEYKQITGEAYES
ncbi:MAG: XkdX family protein [Clostridia bacterium]|nr:XkdX family protein [Clostridia bacterium]